MNVANGQSLIVQHYVRLYTRIGNLKIKLFLRVIETPLPIVLGYPFLAWYNPTINWAKRSMQINFGGKTTTVPTVFAGGVITHPEPMLNVMSEPPETHGFLQSASTQHLPTSTLTVPSCPTSQTPSSNITLQVQRLSDNAVLPIWTSDQAAGYDLSSA